MANAVKIANHDGAIEVVTFDQKLNRFLACFGGDECVVHVLRLVSAAIDGEQGCANRDARIKRGTTPLDVANHVFLVDNEAQRIFEIGIAAIFIRSLGKDIGLIGIDQFPAAAAQRIERIIVARAVEPSTQKCFPIIGGHAIERRHDIFKRVGAGGKIIGGNGKKCSSKIIQRALFARQFADFKIRIQP